MKKYLVLACLFLGVSQSFAENNCDVEQYKEEIQESLSKNFNAIRSDIAKNSDSLYQAIAIKKNFSQTINVEEYEYKNRYGTPKNGWFIDFDLNVYLDAENLAELMMQDADGETIRVKDNVKFMVVKTNAFNMVRQQYGQTEETPMCAFTANLVKKDGETYTDISNSVEGIFLEEKANQTIVSNNLIKLLTSPLNNNTLFVSTVQK